MSLSGLVCLHERNYSHVREKMDSESMRERERRERPTETERERKKNWGYLTGEEGPTTSDRDFHSHSVVVVIFFLPGFVFLFKPIYT